MPKTYQYPDYITSYKGWRIYGARNIRGIPYRMCKTGKRTYFAESMRDAKAVIDSLVAGGK